MVFLGIMILGCNPTGTASNINQQNVPQSNPATTDQKNDFKID